MRPLAQLATSLFPAGGQAGLRLFVPYPRACSHYESTSQQKATLVTEWSPSITSFRADASTHRVVGERGLQEAAGV